VPGHAFENGFDLTLRPERLSQPLEWKKPRMIFVNSMSDLFHKEVPKSHISRVFDTMEKADWHIYQVLTKRSSLLRKFINERYRARRAPAHMWFGVSVENEQAAARISHLQAANAGVRFLSIEPLIAPIGELDLKGIDWVIVGGESGPGARPIDPQWVINIRNQCVKAKVAFFFKQWGGRSPKSGGRLLEGREWNEFPMELPSAAQQRQFQMVGAWSELKLDIVENYGSAYTKAFNKSRGLKKYYIDGFSGPGAHVSKKTRTIVEGSPARALKVCPPFDGYFFVDLNPEKTDYLRSNYGHRSDVNIYTGASKPLAFTRCAICSAPSRSRIASICTL